MSSMYIRELCNNNSLYHIYKIIDFFWAKMIKLFDKILINYWYNKNFNINIINEINKWNRRIFEENALEIISRWLWNAFKILLEKFCNKNDKSNCSLNIMIFLE